MKCPNCGRWNRATLPRCFYCSAPLPQSERKSAEERRLENEQLVKPGDKVIYSVNEFDDSATPRPDDRDRLAREMQSFHSRRKRGEEQQRRILQESAESGFAPRMQGIWTESRATRIYSEPAFDEVAENDIPEGEIRPDAIPAPKRSPQVYSYEEMEEIPTYRPMWEDRPHRRTRSRNMNRRHVRIFGLHRFVPYLALILIVSALLISGYYFILKPLNEQKQEIDVAQTEIIASLLNDMAAHTIRIPAEDGAQIYIKELRKSYIAAGGYAEIVVADYTWYELNKNIVDPTMEVTLTPYIKTSAGEQKLLDPITYSVDIPLSPLTLITPDSTYAEVSTSPFIITFQVAQNSTVFINGEDYSSFVNTQDGKITYNATVQAIGENVFDIVVNCQYYRQNTARIVLYRAPQDIPLELSATLGSTSANQLMTIRGTTIPEATLTITSPYENLDTSKLKSSGEFSFEARFDKIGTNVITIIAENDGHTATLNKEVYYVPYASTYTPKAWAMDASGYIEYLNNYQLRVARTQIYECVGTIVEILGNKPQLALMDTGTDGSERLVLLENMSRDTWVVGERYRVYADAYGIYDGKPRLVARYTYAPRD